MQEKQIPVFTLLSFEAAFQLRNIVELYEIQHFLPIRMEGYMVQSSSFSFFSL